MSAPSRRTFLKSTLPAAAVATGIHPGLFATAAEERRSPTIAYIGCGGRSLSLSDGFQGQAEVAWVCDPDQGHAQRLQKKTGAQRVTADLRDVLADDAVDAVVIATPDHWHATAAILACDAGKHVYVEKPCSHNVVEGQLLVAAARRNGVIVQHGTQSRSHPLIAGAVQLLQEGIIGEVLMAKAWNIQRRANIGHAQPGDPPQGLDYDLWVGPAEYVPFQVNRFHYNWHWWWNFGTGDAGNDGVHELDYARWGLGVEGYPTRVAGLGNKYYFDDDQQFPDSITCSYEWDRGGTPRQLIFEMRIWSRNYPYNCDNGVEFYGTKGRMFLTKRGKMEIVDERNRPLAAEPQNRPQTPPSHQRNFLDCIRSGESPTAEIQIGFDSTILAHYANIVARCGQSFSLDSQSGMSGNPQVDTLQGRSYRQGGHWAVPNML